MGGSIHPFPTTRVTRPREARRQPAEDVCTQCKVLADGRVVCGKVGRGQRHAEVSPALCATCPAKMVNCKHLRYTLRKDEPVPIVVRYAGGRTEVWDDVPPSMKFSQAACALRREPIQSPADCAGCVLRQGQAERGGGMVVPLRPAPVRVEEAVHG